MQPHHLNQIELSRRWNISHRTLERCRSIGHGPDFLKLGGRVLYRLSDIETYEQEKLHSAIKVSNAVDRSGQAVRRLTGDPARASYRTHAAPRGARAC